MPTDVEDIYPLTPVQQGILLHALRAPDSGAYHVQVQLDLGGDRECLLDAWARAYAQHPALRSAVVWDELDSPVQVVHAHVALPLTEWDWRDERDVDARFGELMRADRARPFTLEQAPLSRLVLCRLDSNSYRLLWSYHHILLDGWSSQLVLREVLGDDPPPTRTPFSAYVAWQRQQPKADAFWHTQLADVREPTPLSWSPRLPASIGSARMRRQRALPAPLTTTLTELARTHRMTLNTLVVAAWGIALGHLAGRDDVVVGTTLGGRPDTLPGASSVVGMTINTLPVRLRVASDVPCVAWLAALQSTLLDIGRHEHSALTDVQRQTDVPADKALFESVVVSHGFPADFGPRSRDFDIRAVRYEEFSQYPLAILWRNDGELTMELLADPARLTSEAADAALERTADVLTAFATATGDVTLADLLPRPRPPAPPDTPLPPVVADLRRQVNEHPARVAVADNGVELTYLDLASAAASLQARLADLGVAPGDAVAMQLPSDARAIVTLWALFALGVVYVPLHADAPSGRRQKIVNTAGCKAIVSEQALQDIDVPTVTLSRDDLRQRRSQQPVYTESPADATAYVLFTSGSTGEPKGVRVTYANLAYSTGARIAYYGHAPTSYLLLSPPAFDSAMAGIFWTLCHGGRLVLASDAERRDPDAIADLIEAHQVTHTLCVPPLYHSILTLAPPDKLARLDLAIVAGEACPDALPRLHRDKLPGVRLFNEYGPTEATVWCAVARIDDTANGPVPIGEAIPGTALAVVDHLGRCLPPGAVGELVVMGAGVAAGYLGAASEGDGGFVSLGDSRAYLTGDLAYVSDGAVYCVGRRDRQVKIRGHRIELGEIEAALRAVPGVADAAVIVANTEARTPDDATLAAWCAQRRGRRVAAEPNRTRTGAVDAQRIRLAPGARCRPGFRASAA